MCGLVGLLRRGGLSAPRDTEALARMTDRLTHRGPDDRGLWTDPAGGVALGHRRLAVIDPSELGHQPMRSPCGRYVIVYNGELYNFRSIRSRLGVHAYGFRSDSDTEVLVTAIAEWGLEETLRQANGMFAFAVWDRSREELCLARDRFGEKPLYYGEVNGLFLFTSELKGMMAHPDFHPRLDRDALTLYLRYGYVPGPYSIFDGVKKLLPGNLLRIGSTSTRENLSQHPYWSLRTVAMSGQERLNTGSVESATHQLEGVLRNAVRERMVADVPLGAFLSGGLDSSTICALMQSESAKPTRTFTIGFHDDAFDEAAHARQVARHLGTDHSEVYLTTEDAREVVPMLPHLYDEPFSDPSQIPTYLLSRLARREVTVALTGDGGDELFGGYSRYLWLDRLAMVSRKTPRISRLLLSRLMDSVPPSAWSSALRFVEKVIPGFEGERTPGERITKFSNGLKQGNPADLYLDVVSNWKEPAAIVRFSSEPESVPSSPRNWPDLGGFVNLMMYLDSCTYLPDDILVKTDRASMGVSLEVRTPMLDPSVAVFAWSLPLSLKMRSGQGKWLLRRVLERFVPANLTERPKAGFDVPIASWLRGPLRSWAEELLNIDRLNEEGIFYPDPIRSHWNEHLSGSHNHQQKLWTILMFQAWLEEWEVEIPPERPEPRA